MKELEIDIETQSDRDIKKCGVYAYADSPHFAVTFFSVSVDGGAVQLYDLTAGDVIPDEILNALVDESIIKRAFNVQFERVCLSKYLHVHYPEIFSGYSINEDTVHDYLNPRSWQCTMIHARYLGLPSSLAQVGEVLKLQQQKLTEGKALIKFFCVPYDYENGVPLFHNPANYPEKWELFKKYNICDVESELEIDRRLSKYPVPDNIWEEFYLDQEINDRGIAVDMEFVEAALTLDGQAKAKLSADMRRLTGIDNPNSVYQLLDWLEKQGYASDTLDKAKVKEMLKTAKEPVKSVLELRQQLSKSSVKKYTAMQTAVCSDHRARGMRSLLPRKSWILSKLPQNRQIRHLQTVTSRRNSMTHYNVRLLKQKMSSAIYKMKQRKQIPPLQSLRRQAQPCRRSAIKSPVRAKNCCP